ncbi:DUF481 domain-containing protein [Pendulispora rubella]|uniref:DUF481 domain-containing protein n=1 Tax=Pendulispora rubella TaxID=2741070 RepID=A0ABZ2LE79_9BACT
MSAKTLLRGSIAATLSLFATAAQAQTTTPPPRTAGGTATQTSASTGATTVVKDSFASGPTRDTKDGTAATVQAGGLFSTGNARSLAVTASGTYRYRQDNHQFSAGAAINYGRAAAKQDAPIETTVSNLQALLRYDYFFTDKWALFVQAAGRRDKFQGLDLRANIDPGVAYYVLDDKKHRLWFELGYDFQHDIRRGFNVDQARAVVAAAEAAERNGTGPGPTAVQKEAANKTADRHSSRLFFGYDNQLNAYITFTTGLEYLQPFDPTEAWRLTWNNALKSAITDKFSAATTFTLRYDHSPLPNVKDTDAITSVAIIYNFR